MPGEVADISCCPFDIVDGAVAAAWPPAPAGFVVDGSPAEGVRLALFAAM